MSPRRRAAGYPDRISLGTRLRKNTEAAGSPPINKKSVQIPPLAVPIYGPFNQPTDEHGNSGIPTSPRLSFSQGGRILQIGAAVIRS